MAAIYRKKLKEVYPSCFGVGWFNKDTLEGGFAVNEVIA
jgi:hypothetical protein